MSIMPLKIALIQLTSNDDPERNITHVRALVADAAGRGAELVATPENTFLMEAPGTERTFYTQENHPGVKAAAEMAKLHKLWLLVGSVAVKVDDSGKTMNRSLLINPEGNIAAHYDKIHLFDVEVGDGQSYRESAKFLPGAHAVMVATPWAKLGMTICYDLRFPHLYRELAKLGAEILAVPSAFTQVTGEAHWHVLLRSRAIENGCYVIAPAQCGTHPGNRKTFGHSLIVDPWGEVVVDGGTKEGVVMAEIDLDKVKQVQAKIPSLKHDREFKPV
jgi:deaminated glutathione amidase